MVLLRAKENATLRYCVHRETKSVLERFCRLKQDFSRVLYLVLMFGYLNQIQSQQPTNGNLNELLAGQLTWSIDPLFSEGKRNVYFRLALSYVFNPQCDLKNQVCTDGSKIASFGQLCTEQYTRETMLPINNTGIPKLQLSAEASCYSIDATQYNIRSVNGVPVVSLVFHHEMWAEQNVSGILAYLCIPNGTLLPKCDGNQIPCALNSTPPIRTGFKEFGGFYEPYWDGFEPYVNGTCTGSNAPAFETFINLCASTVENNCQGRYSGISNYYSPEPSVSPILEISQNPVYREAENQTYAKSQQWVFGFFERNYVIRNVSYNISQNLTVNHTIRETRNITVNFTLSYQVNITLHNTTTTSTNVTTVSYVESIQTAFNVSVIPIWEEQFYLAPYPPFHLQSSDRDGHLMAFFDYSWRNKFSTRDRSNIQAECFIGDHVKNYSWPFAHTYAKLDEVGACNYFFDGDGSGGR
eukprot:766408-Hanusia_phi.AAC.2